MRTQAVIFDLFETLITEWGHKKYTKSEMCADLGINRDAFDQAWENQEEARYLGEVSFLESLSYVCEQCGVKADTMLLSRMLDQRIKTKSECFNHVLPDVLQLLSALKSMGLRLAIVSNCSDEEVVGIEQSKIHPFFDSIILSYEVKLQKPNVHIYQEAARSLGVALEHCVFVGDGGSHELEGAQRAGMTAIQAKWYTNQHPWKRDSIPGFLVAEEPLEVLPYIQQS